MLILPSRRTRKQPILIVLHQERSSPGRVGQMLVEKSYPLDIRRPVLGDPLPDTLAEHSGAVIFGGPMSANDPIPSSRRKSIGSECRSRKTGPFSGFAWARR